MTRPVVLVLGPERRAISGVAAHVNALFASPLARRFELAHFQVGREGREEGPLARLARLLASPVRLAAAIARSGAGIVHINTSLDTRGYFRDIAYLAVAKALGARVVYQIHDNLFRVLGGKRTAFAPGLTAVARCADAVVVLSAREADAWRARRRAPALQVVPNGIDCAPYLEERRAPHDPGGPLRLVYLGRLAPGKGLAESIEAMRLSRARGVPARLVIAGSGPEEARLREQVADHGLHRQVSFAGAAFGEQKRQLLSQADALLLASHSEGLPYALLEAMASGVVPVVTPVGAVPEVVVDGEHGLVVRPGDAEAIAQAIARLAGERAGLARMSAACRRRAADYSLERLARDLGALYGTLCAARAPRTAL